MVSLLRNSLAEEVWRGRYRARRPDGTLESGPAETLDRVAAALAATEADPTGWRTRFRAILEDFRFLPGGRILAGAGTEGTRALLNCFVMGPIRDTRQGILEAVGEGIETLAAGGGIGWDLSTLEAAGDAARATGASGIGPIGFLRLMDAACAAFTAGSARGGAMMATLRPDHPDVESFVVAKSPAGAMTRFNLSIQVTGTFLQAVDADAAWPLRPGIESGGEPRTRRARALWDLVVANALAASEPGVLFVDTINRENNLHWRERLTTTNPCGEAPLPHYGACDLGSLNLACFVRDPFTAAAGVDFESLTSVAATAVRLLDDVLDVSVFPLERQRREALATRRIGLGVTGLADALAMLGLDYDSPGAREAAADIVRRIKLAAYEASAAIAREKGPFPAFDRERFLAGSFISRLPAAVCEAIARHGIRNSHLLAIAPTGSVSLLAGNVAPGIEPIPARVQQRRVRMPGGGWREFQVEDFAWARYGQSGGRGPAAFVEAAEVSPEAQVDMQAALQAEVDGAISKTVLLPDGYRVEELDRLLRRADRAGLKGLTVHRPGSTRGNVLGPGCAADEGAAEPCDPP